MIDRYKAYVGMPVMLQDSYCEIRRITIDADGWRCNLIGRSADYFANELDPADPPATPPVAPPAKSKRVTVEWEMKRVPKTVVLRMTAVEAEGFSDFICTHELMNKLQDDVRTALRRVAQGVTNET